MTTEPTLVLVHGALTDASVWHGVIARLQARGYTVLAPSVAMRSLAADVAHLRSVLTTLDGPVVVAGHSYGGSIISDSAALTPDVRALVYVAAFQPDRGEITGELNGRFPGGRLGPETTVIRPYPGGADLYLRPEHFAGVYAADVDPGTAAVMAAAQRPIDPAALGETLTGPAAWRTRPSWALVSTADNSLPAPAQRFMAERAGSTIHDRRDRGGARRTGVTPGRDGGSHRRRRGGLTRRVAGLLRPLAGSPVVAPGRRSDASLMSNFDELLQQNARFAATDAKDHVPAIPFLPHRQVYILTCIDPRVDPAAVFGLTLGDAIVARNVGGRVTPAVVKDLAWISFLHETKTPDAEWFEFAVVHHTDCGSGFLADDRLRHDFAGRTGYDDAELAALAVLDPARTVAADVATLAGTPQISPRIKLSGYAYDVKTGLATKIVPARR